MSSNLSVLQVSLEIMRDNLEFFADSFYHNLFSAYPNLKQLFSKTNLDEQKRMLMGIILLVIENWQRPQVWKTILKKLGARHLKYGAIPEYYPLFGEVFLLTLEEYLGSDWTAEVQEAWSDAFEGISEIMLEGACESENEHPDGEKMRDNLSFRTRANF